MLFLITGSLGAGKTSNTLWDLVNNPKFKDRPKFATYIPDFDYEKHNFEQIDKNDLENWVYWQDEKDDFSTVSNFPKGSIIFIDEADLFFPSSISDKNPPRWLREMARSRHHGLDFYIITQQSKMISPFLLGLIQSHIHYHRPNGSDIVTRYSWEHHQPNVYARSNRLLGLPQKVVVNPEVFKLYRSTIENTRLKTPPKHIYIKLGLLLLPMLLVPFFLYWFMYARHVPAATIQPEAQKQVLAQSDVAKTATQDNKQTTNQSVSNNETQPTKNDSLLNPIATTQNPNDYIPVDPLRPYTAPIYQDLAKPTDFPRIAMCITSIASDDSGIDKRFTGGKCKCFTQQYTPVDVPQNACLRMVKEGWFDDFATQRAMQDVVLSGKPDEAQTRQDNQRPST